MLEFGAFSAALPWFSLLPRGRGDHVLVLPGLGGTDISTRPMRSVLNALGHRTHGWRLGRNPGPTPYIVDGMTERFEELVDRSEAPIHLVGWSLGGVYARHLARRYPEHVQQVITMGSPIRSIEADRGWDPPPVPRTNIYSVRDAVVPWRDSCDEPAADAENIRIDAAHLGLGHHPASIVTVADRLAQDVSDWQPFEPPLLASLLFR